MDWNKAPEILAQRYRCISGLNVGPLKMAMLEDMNKSPIQVDSELDTLSYAVFASEFNAIMLTAHMFENLMIFEDKRQELEGNYEFPINIPVRFFRHPSLLFKKETPEENSQIAEVVCKTKSKLNQSKDQSFVLSQLHKLEFISVFSHLEAYIESLLVEVLGFERSKAAMKVKKESLPKTMIEVFNEIDKEIIEFINEFDSEALRFISFCHRLRNLHTHNLGIVNDYFYQTCIDEGFLCHDTFVDTGDPDLEFARLKFQFSNYIVKVGSVVNLSSISQPFRLLSREIVFISEVFCKKKLRK